MTTDHTSEPTLVRIVNRLVSVAEFSDGSTGVLVERVPQRSTLHVPTVAAAAAETLTARQQVEQLIDTLRPVLGDDFLTLSDAISDFATAIRLEAAARLGAAASAVMEDGFDTLIVMRDEAAEEEDAGGDVAL